MSYRIYMKDEDENRFYLEKSFYQEVDAINYFNKKVDELYKNTKIRGLSLIKSILDNFQIKCHDLPRNLIFEYLDYLALDYFDFSEYKNTEYVENLKKQFKPTRRKKCHINL